MQPMYSCTNARRMSDSPVGNHDRLGRVVCGAVWGYLGLFRVSAKEATYPHMQDHNLRCSITSAHTAPSSDLQLRFIFAFFWVYIYFILDLKVTVEVFHDEYIFI